MNWGSILLIVFCLLGVGLMVLVFGLLLMVYDFFEGHLARFSTTIENCRRRREG